MVMSSEVQKRGKLVREVRGPKDKPCPVPFPASPSHLHRVLQPRPFFLATGPLRFSEI